MIIPRMVCLAGLPSAYIRTLLTLLRLLYISPAPVPPTFLPPGGGREGGANPVVLADSKV